MAKSSIESDIPLADDENVPNELNLSSRKPKPAQPLPQAEDQEEKARLIAQILELQNTLEDLSSRVDSVKEESMKLRSENQVLGQYIKNLMHSSSLFQPANSPKTSNMNEKDYEINIEGGEMYENFYW
uniref:Short coiled-coil protein n=1 Tax=Strongyloides papillosus TaxID=174720 RepID=A0A0N5BFR2_STREA